VSGAIPGNTMREQAVALAGALAELGVTSVTITDASGERFELSARVTDLPGTLTHLAQAGGGVLEADGLRVDVTLQTLSWTAQGERADEFRRALGLND